MNRYSKIIVLAAVLLPGGALLLIVPLAKMGWRYLTNAHARYSSQTAAGG